MTQNDSMTYEAFERVGDTTGTFGLWPGVAGVYMENEADVFCRTCAKDILGDEHFERVKEENIHHDELGNVAAVLSSEEWDCPGATCGHCGIGLDVTVIHYEAVCQPDTCPELEA